MTDFSFKSLMNAVIGVPASPAFAGAAKVMIAASFGTSYNDTRAKTIDAIEGDLRTAFPDWDVRRAFTAQTIIDRVAKRDGTKFDNVREAMERLISEGIKEAVVQPTHVMNGVEFDDLVRCVTSFADRIPGLRIGRPLLSSPEDYRDVIEAVFARLPEADEPGTAAVFMGHGTDHFANAAYSQLELMMRAAGHKNAFVGTVEGFPSLDDIKPRLAAGGAKRVVLCPFMIVAGDHARNDMAGDDDSWKSELEEGGYEVVIRMEGLGENPDIRKVYIEHARAAAQFDPLFPPGAPAVKAAERDSSKKAILAASFGTSFNDSRARTIEAIEADIARAYPGWEVRRAFTAQTIIDKLAKRDGIIIDNMEQAMSKLAGEGFSEVVIQPTHIMPGYEYDDLCRCANAYSGLFDRLVISRPLLWSADDCAAAVRAVAADIPEAGAADTAKTAAVLMGHGTQHCANALYSQLQFMFHREGYANVFIGTVEGFPTIDEVAAELKAFGARRAVLCPFMIVAGDHAVNDMAGDGPESWKSILAGAGYEVECRVMGLGENAEIRAILLGHLADAIGRTAPRD